MFISGGGPLSMMEVWYDTNKPEMVKWVMEKAAYICEKEARDLMNRASQGPHATDANILRLTSSMVTVKDVETFRVPLLLRQYKRITPNFQHILKAFIGKSGPQKSIGSRDPDLVSHITGVNDT